MTDTKELLDKELKKGKFLMFDETPLEVLKYSEAEARKEFWEDREYRSKEDADGHERKCYMWLLSGAGLNIPCTHTISDGLEAEEM